MNTQRAAFILALGAISIAGLAVAQQRRSLRATQATAASLKLRAASIDAELTTAAAELQATDKELASIRREAKNTPTSDTALSQWSATTLELKDIFRKRPEQAIPELALLDHMAWLNLALDSDLESELGTRKALAAARTMAKEKLKVQFGAAWRKYITAHAGEMPASMQDLGALIDPPPDPAILARYTLTRTGNVSGIRPSIVSAIVEQQPIDETFDSRVVIDTEAGGAGNGSSPPWVQSLHNEAIRDASYEFAKTHAGDRPTNRADLIPYIQEPAMKAVVQAEADFAHANGGRSNQSAGDLFPYLVSAEDRALAAKIWVNK